MADIVPFPRPKAQRLPQTNVAVVALVGGSVIAAADPDMLDDLTDAQLTQAAEEVAGLMEKLMDRVEQRSIKAQR